MPRINEATKGYPKGYLLDEDDLSLVSDEFKFVVAPAADNLNGRFNDPGSYVKENWARQVDTAALLKMSMGALITIRVNGTKWPIDHVAPEKDQSLIGFLHALKNKTYSFIVIMMISEDSTWATIKAAKFYREQLEHRTGKKVFLVVNPPLWESNEDWSTLLGSDGSDWNLYMIGQYVTGIGSPIFTPGYWQSAEDSCLIWEDHPGHLIAWPPFLSTPVEEEEEPTEEEQPAEDELLAEIKKLNAFLERIWEVLMQFVNN